MSQPVRSGHSHWAGLVTGLVVIALTLFGVPPGARAGTPQQISFEDLFDFEINDYQVVEPTASSGLPVTVTVDTPDVCTWQAPYLTAVKAGTCQVTARQPGNAQFDPAEPVVRTTTVNRLGAGIRATPPEIVYTPDDPVHLAFQVVQAQPREGDPTPTGTVNVKIRPLRGSEDLWEFNLPLNAEGFAEMDFNDPPIPLEPRSYGILYYYSGDANYREYAAEEPLVFDIVKGLTRTVLTVSPQSATWGDDFTFDVKVVSAKTGEIPDDIEGDVNFFWTIKGGAASVPLVNGRAQFTTSDVSPGANQVLAQYVNPDDFTWGTSWDKKQFKTTGLDPYLAYPDGLGAVGVPLQPLNPISRGILDPTFAASGLPAGLAIDPDSGEISGVPAREGKSSVTVTATDPNEDDYSTELTITVVKSSVTPTIGYPRAKAQAGRAMTPLTPQVTGMSPPVSVTAVGLPAGLSVNRATGVISGTPSQVGTFTPTVTAVAVQGTATTTVSLEITSGPVVPYVAYPNAQGVAGSPLVPLTPYTAGLTGSLAFTGSGLPDGLTLDSGTGVVSGTPTTPGSSSVTVTVTGAEGTATTTFSARITGSPLPKRLAYPTVRGQQHQRIDPVVPQTSGLTGSLRYTARNLPRGLRIDPGTGVLTGKPKVSGKHVAKVRVTGNNGQARAKVRMRFARNRGHKPGVPLTVTGARKASADLSAGTATRLISRAEAKGKARVHAHVSCMMGSRPQAASVCAASIARRSHRVTVTPHCSIPQVTVTLRVTAQPTEKQAQKYNPRTWNRSWSVSGAPAKRCVEPAR
ncbi:MAG: putative Ig domain-containing protein [Candidatus Nanopelagicales bacterium]